MLNQTTTLGKKYASYKMLTFCLTKHKRIETQVLKKKNMEKDALSRFKDETK